MTTGAAIDSGIDGVRAELFERLARVSRTAPHTRAAEIAREIDAIRAIAQGHGLGPAVAVAHLVDDALARGEQGALVRGWLDVLGQAIASERVDAHACAAFTAACSVRLAH